MTTRFNYPNDDDQPTPKRKSRTPYAVAGGIAGLVGAVACVALFDVSLVRGGQVGVALRGDKATVFTGFKVTGPGTKVVKFDRAVLVDTKIEFGENGAPTPETVTIKAADGGEVFIDARAIMRLDSPCGEGPARCLTDDDKRAIAGLAVNFRKEGQGGIERTFRGVMMNAGNLVGADFADVDTALNGDRRSFQASFEREVRERSEGEGLDLVQFVVERWQPSPQAQAAINELQTKRAQTAQAEQDAKTAEKAKDKAKAESDAAAYDIEAKAKAEAAASLVRAEAEAKGIQSRGAAYAANPTVASVDQAKFYSEGANTIVVTDSDSEVRPIITTGGQQP